MKVLRIHVRRSFATTAAALLIATPLLSSCGFNNSTDRVSDNTIGLDDRSGSVDILAAVIVAGQPDAGTFVATLSNKSSTKTAALESLSGAGGNTVTADDFEPVSIPPQGFVNLAVDGGVKVTGSFGAGDVIPMSIGFEDGESIEMNIVVVTACEEYAGLDPSESATPSASASPSSATSSNAPTPSASTPTASSTASDQPGDEVTVEPSETPTATGSSLPSEEAAADADAYSCEYAPSTE